MENPKNSTGGFVKSAVTTIIGLAVFIGSVRFSGQVDVLRFVTLFSVLAVFFALLGFIITSFKVIIFKTIFRKSVAVISFLFMTAAIVTHICLYLGAPYETRFNDLENVKNYERFEDGGAIISSVIERYVNSPTWSVDQNTLGDFFFGEMHDYVYVTIKGTLSGMDTEIVYSVKNIITQKQFFKINYTYYIELVRITCDGKDLSRPRAVLLERLLFDAFEQNYSRINRYFDDVIGDNFSDWLFSSDNSSIHPQNNSNHPPETQGFIGVHYVSIEDAWIYEGNPSGDYITVEVAFTNNSDLPVSFDSVIKSAAYQNNFVCKNAPTHDERAKSDVEPGATVTVTKAFYVNDSSSTVEVEFTTRQISNSDIISEVFSID